MNCSLDHLPTGEARLHMAAVRAALDREEAAARDLERVTALVALTLEPNDRGPIAVR